MCTANLELVAERDVQRVLETFASHDFDAVCVQEWTSTRVRIQSGEEELGSYKLYKGLAPAVEEEDDEAERWKQTALVLARHFAQRVRKVWFGRRYVAVGLAF